MITLNLTAPQANHFNETGRLLILSKVDPQPDNRIDWMRPDLNNIWRVGTQIGEIPEFGSWQCPFTNLGEIVGFKEPWKESRHISDQGAFYYLEEADSAPGDPYWFRRMPAADMPEDCIRLFGKCSRIEARKGKLISDPEMKLLNISEVKFYPDDGFPLCKGYMLGRDDGKTGLNVHPCEAIGIEPEAWCWFALYEKCEKGAV